MTYRIKAADCTCCGACETECPQNAISLKKGGGTYVIDQDLCTDCKGTFPKAQCAEVCPADCCVPT